MSAPVFLRHRECPGDCPAHPGPGTPTRFRGIRRAGILAALLLNGCVSVPTEGPPATVYLLQPSAELSSDTRPSVAYGLRIARPQVVRHLSGDTLATVRGDYQWQGLADARWAAPLPKLLNDYLERRLAAQIAFRDLGGSQATRPLEHRLELTVYAFNARHPDGADDPTVHIAARFTRLGPEGAVRHFTVDRQERVANNRRAIVAGLDTLWRTIVDEMSRALLLEGNPPRPSASSPNSGSESDMIAQRCA